MSAAEPKPLPVSTSRTTVGVAMCTCNGEQFLRAQLDSIAIQSRKPDHVVVFDDVSNDNTWSILENWKSDLAASSTMRVTLHRNERRLGIVKNFESATRALDTDLIFLCDQDDVWLPEKVSIVEAAFHADPQRSLVFTDAELIDAQGVPLDSTLFDRLRISPSDSNLVESDMAFAMLCRRNVVTGAATAYRRVDLQASYPFPTQWLHDEWLAIMTAAGAGRLHCIRTPTTLYRQHAGNTVGARRTTLFTDIRRVWWRMNAAPARGFSENFRQRCKVLTARLVALNRDPRWIAIADRMLAFAEFRSNLPESRPMRLISVVKRAGQYRQFTERLEEFARDLANR